jgi:4'-phosphopantetheinyl transferase
VTSWRDQSVTFPPVAEFLERQTERVTLKNGTVDLWSCSLQGDAAVLERCHASLSEEERARAARFVRPDDRIRFTFAHGSLRVVLARYLGVDPVDLRFSAGLTGKPALRSQQSSPHSLRFNLSHSHGRMLVAVADGQDVGIDLEQVRDSFEPLKLAERFYTQAEYESIKSLPTCDQAVEFTRLWVAKEALLKAHGVGIPSLQHCEILASPSSSRASVRLKPGSALPHGWTVEWLSCGQGWQGAVSAYGNDWSVRIFDTMNV